MMDFKENVIEEIKNAPDTGAVENVIAQTVGKMQEKSVHTYIIARFLQKLNQSLASLEKNTLTNKQLANIQEARQILLKKDLEAEKERKL